MLINPDVRITGLIKQHIPPTILSAADTGERRKILPFDQISQSGKF